MPIWALQFFHLVEYNCFLLVTLSYHRVNLRKSLHNLANLEKKIHPENSECSDSMMLLHMETLQFVSLEIYELLHFLDYKLCKNLQAPGCCTNQYF